MGKYPLTEMAVKMFCPGNVVQLDDAGLPSLLVWIPKFKNSDVLTGGDDSTHPAFIVNGREIPGFYYSKYQNVVHNGMAYSLPAEDPDVSATFDTALEYCEAKGYGWHLSTAAEWAAIALWCKKNGFLPYGNNDNGKDSRETDYKAIPSAYGNDGAPSRVATGTGPRTWSHDCTASGIWDMNGNVWEWQSGLRLVWGELQILANNDAADPDNPQNETSTCWRAINAADGTLVDPECIVDGAAVLAGQTVRLDLVDNVWTFSTGITSADSENRVCNFGKVTSTASIGEGAKALLRALALLPEDGASPADYGDDNFWAVNGAAECMAWRGGQWYRVEKAGIFSLGMSNQRTHVNGEIGLRAVYIQNI